MPPKQGGLGRRPGKKDSCKQKKVTATSATAKSMAALRRQKELGEKILARRSRRQQNLESSPVIEHRTMVQAALDAKNEADKRREEAEIALAAAKQQLAKQEADLAALRQSAQRSKQRSAARHKKVLSTNKNLQNQVLAKKKCVRVEERGKVEALKEAERQRLLRLAALKRARAAEKGRVKAKEHAQKRLGRTRELQEECSELRSKVVEVSDAKKCTDIKFCKVTNQARGGAHTWPLWMVQLILEQLVNGTPPSAISANIASQAALTMPDRPIHELPGINYIRNCRTVLRIIGETMTAYRLAKVPKWEQLFTDGTSRRQVALQNLIVGIMEDKELMPLILSSSMILEDETSEKQVAAVAAMIRCGGRRLQRWAEVIKQQFPDYVHDIPPPSAMNIGKLGSGGAITSDTCNGARKTRRLLVDVVKDAAKEMSTAQVIVFEIDCWGHLRNVWLNGMNVALSDELRERLEQDLEHTDARLRVSPNIGMILRAVDKEFSLCANYPKGHGEVFKEWMEQHHPGALLFHVERASGSRQDLCVEGAGAIYWNRKYWIEFLDDRLRNPGDNILQENLFILLSSCEMIALARVCSIVHIAICLPSRWLAGNTHKLAQYDWSVRSMGRMVDLLQKALVEVAADGQKMLDESFMMGIFDELIDELPPLKEYMNYIFDTKRTAVVASSKQKVVPFSMLRAELFSPQSETNVDTSGTAADLGAIAASALLDELRDHTKATAEYLSSVKGKYSWGQCTAEEHNAAIGKMANNDAAERCFGGATGEIQCFGRVGLTNAGGVGQVRINGDLSRGYDSRTTKKHKLTRVIFHQLTDEMHTSLLITAMEDAPSVRVNDREALAKQRAAKRRKEELAREHALECASEKYIDAIYYNEMRRSAACWRTCAAVDRELRKLKSKSAQLHALKENIRMRVIGLGWDDLATTWSQGGKEYSPSYLASHLKMIIAEERKRPIPEKPPAKLPQRKTLPSLGTQAKDVVAIDRARTEMTDEFEAKARSTRAEREAVGVGDRYAEMQPMSRPAVDERLIGKRLDVCVLYNLDEGGSELRWCQGVVTAVSNGSNIVRTGSKTACYKAGEAVMIRWDENKARNEPSSESGQRLLPSKWNPRGVHREGCWRFDIEEVSK